ncbi:SDR family NAD(P)-dependent oxidoreductase [Brumimicrobium oceani]|uniref:Short-chain dehydrogenase n=1 Tax=Brumimicrobium oceani TaxID=2100725 RepID=A0A2U2X0X8_9FLAO|nr:SDR family NAD(P)-dependent oxidoreductase [Brumimicrobium oceani]PWH81419.1 short-chain dehydrogenase [Brumimicrobium oceani]
MIDFKNKTTLITGGASGIGKIMARLLLERGAKVILWDINTQGIADVIAEFKEKGEICGYTVDISDQEQVKSSAKEVKKEQGVVDILINNAGIIVGKYFHEHSTEEISATAAINANAPMIITSCFIKDMMDQNFGSVCNIASSGGLISNPKMSVYAASKWSLIGWSDSVRLEMSQLKKNIHFTTIMPYYINTGMFDGVKSKIPILDQEAASLTIIKAIEKKKVMVTLPGWIYRVTRLGQAVMPIKMFDWFAGSIMGIYKTMENFIGRK